MTLYAPIKIRCDVPHQVLSDLIAPCNVALDTYTHSQKDARAVAKENGWRHVAGFDFCGPATDETPHARNHAETLRRHRPTMRQVLTIEQLGKRYLEDGGWSVRCSCTWTIGSGVVHPYICENGLVNSRKSGLAVWMEAHVRVDVLGLPPRWTTEEVERHRRHRREYAVSLRTPEKPDAR